MIDISSNLQAKDLLTQCTHMCADISIDRKVTKAMSGSPGQFRSLHSKPISMSIFVHNDLSQIVRGARPF